MLFNSLIVLVCLLVGFPRYWWIEEGRKNDMRRDELNRKVCGWLRMAMCAANSSMRSAPWKPLI